MEASIIITLNRPKSPDSFVPSWPDPALSVAVFFVSLRLSGQSTLEKSHLCAQNKPNPKNFRIHTIPCTSSTYTNIPPRPTQKNRPNSNPIPARRETIQHRDSSIRNQASCLTYHAIMALYPCAYEALMQNKPNLQNPKTTATYYPRKTYPNTPPRSTQKNKPKQTQSRDTQYATRCTLYANLALADAGKTTTMTLLAGSGSPLGRDEQLLST